MSRAGFIKGNLESLLGDSDVKERLDKAQSPEERREFTNRAKSILGRSYDTYAADYNSKKGFFKSGASLALKVGGLGVDLIGDYGIITMGAGFLMKRYGALPLKSAAAAIDAQHYAAHAKTDSGIEKAAGLTTGVAEELAEKSVSAFVPGVGVIDFLRSTIWNKYNAKVNSYAKGKAKEMFLKESDNEPYILKLDRHFAHPEYGKGEEKEKASETREALAA